MLVALAATRSLLHILSKCLVGAGVFECGTSQEEVLVGSGIIGKPTVLRNKSNTQLGRLMLKVRRFVSAISERGQVKLWPWFSCWSLAGPLVARHPPSCLLDTGPNLKQAGS